METLEEIKVRLRKLDKPRVDLVEAFAPMLYTERYEHARTSNARAQCEMTLVEPIEVSEPQAVLTL